MLERFWSKLNEFNGTSRGERKGFVFEKNVQFIGSELLKMVSGLIKIKPSRRCTKNIGAIYEFDQNKNTFSVSFDELEH